ncbi:hypothetical protein D3C71_1735910 [compost metagenome]
MESAQGVPHGMGVFAQNVRLLRIAARVLLNLAGLDVHRRFDIARRFGRSVMIDALIVDESCRIGFLQEVMHGDEAVAPERLVAERPDDNRRMILVPLEHRIAAVQHISEPFGPACRHVEFVQLLLSVFPGAVRL